MYNNRFIPVLFITLFLSSCSGWDNFITYFNTYYNADRLIEVAEDDFEYYEERRRVVPGVYMPEPENLRTETNKNGIPDFMREFEITPVQRQTMATKLDSVIIKGSKILANHPKSDYIEGTLFLMAKAYFYRNEYLPSQIKCSELVDKFPGGQYSPDAHLLFAKNLLMQRNFEFGNLMLSRSVDIAWQLERYDILSEAFRLQAEVALYNHDKDAAVRPYLQAIAQSEDSEFAAELQKNLAVIYYRLGLLEEAVDAFEKVDDYSPSYLSMYEADLYKAISLAKLGKNQEAAEIIDYLDNDGKFEEWKDFTYAGKMYVMEQLLDDKELIAYEKKTDTTREVNNNRLLAVYYYERGIKYYDDNEFAKANSYLTKAKTSKTPALYDASFKSQNIGDIFRYRKLIQDHTAYEDIENDTVQSELNKTTRAKNKNAEVASLLYETGRAFERLGELDSAYVYYKQSSAKAPDDPYSARYYHAWQRFERQNENYFTADSIAEFIADRYPNTEFGIDAMEQIGLIVEKFVVDTIVETYDSGQSLRANGDYDYAVQQFKKTYSIAKDRPGETDYAAKSLYAIGWTYEHDLKKRDSASVYYYRLVDEYPNTEYAKEFILSKQFMAALRSGQPIPDSLQLNPNRTEVPEFKPYTLPKPVMIDNQAQNPGVFDMILDPSSLLEKSKELITNTISDTYNSIDSTVKSGANDLDSLRNMEMPSMDSLLKQDSTSTSPSSDTIDSNPISIPTDTVPRK